MNNKLRISVDLLYDIQVIEDFLEETVNLLIPIWYNEFNKIAEVHRTMHELYENILKKLIYSQNNEVVDSFIRILEYLDGLVISLKMKNPNDIYTQPYPEFHTNLMKDSPNFALQTYYYDQLALGC